MRSIIQIVTFNIIFFLDTKKHRTNHALRLMYNFFERNYIKNFSLSCYVYLYIFYNAKFKNIHIMYIFYTLKPQAQQSFLGISKWFH